MNILKLSRSLFKYNASVLDQLTGIFLGLVNETLNNQSDLFFDRR